MTVNLECQTAEWSICFYRQLVSIWGPVNNIMILMPINHTSHPDFRSILQKPINVNIRMQSCLQVIHSGNHTQVAKSRKVTVREPDRHYFIPRLVELHVAMLTSRCGCNAVCVLAARFMTCLLAHMMCALKCIKRWQETRKKIRHNLAQAYRQRGFKYQSILKWRKS